MSDTYNLKNLSKRQIEYLLELVEIHVLTLVKAGLLGVYTPKPASYIDQIEEELTEAVAMWDVLRETRKGGYNGEKK